MWKSIEGNEKGTHIGRGNVLKRKNAEKVADAGCGNIEGEEKRLISDVKIDLRGKV